MAMNRGMAVPRGWFGIVRKKFLIKTKFTNGNNNSKNIIIIHNNTSITSNDEDNRSSCVEAKDRISTADKANNATGTVAPTVSGKMSSKDEEGVKVGSGLEETSGDDDQNKEVEKKPTDDQVVVGGEGKDPSSGGVDGSLDDGKIEGRENEVEVEKEAEEEEKGPSEEEIAIAAIRIQTVFRGHLARRAFKALKGLVKLQAVVRGVCVRRQARMALDCMHTLARLQGRVRARQVLSKSSGNNE